MDDSCLAVLFNVQRTQSQTTTSKTLLDVIIAPESMNFVTFGCLHSSISDHSLIYCVLPKKVPEPVPMTKTVRSYRNFDVKKFENDVKRSNLNSAATSCVINEAGITCTLKF